MISVISQSSTSQHCLYNHLIIYKIIHSVHLKNIINTQSKYLLLLILYKIKYFMFIQLFNVTRLCDGDVNK